MSPDQEIEVKVALLILYLRIHLEQTFASHPDNFNSAGLEVLVP